MAVIPITQNTPTSFVDTATHALTVTVTLTGVAFSVYARITRAGTTVAEWKILHGQSASFNIIKDDSVVAHSCGTGNITVTTT